MKQLYNVYGIPLPKHINKHALHYPRQFSRDQANTLLINEFNWSLTSEGHDFWENVDQAESIEEIWDIWETKHPGTRDPSQPVEPKKQPTLDDIFTL